MGEQFQLFWGQQVVGLSFVGGLLLPLLFPLLLWVCVISERRGL